MEKNSSNCGGTTKQELLAKLREIEEQIANLPDKEEYRSLTETERNVIEANLFGTYYDNMEMKEPDGTWVAGCYGDGSITNYRVPINVKLKLQFVVED